jgi:MSHA type pilus biogenesis protein MshL
MIRKLIVLACCGYLAGCGTAPMKTSPGIPGSEPQRPGAIPPPVTQVAPIPVPKPSPKLELYSVSVVNVPVQEILFALARDARLNVDIHPGVSGNVTLNAIDQTLPQILSRIAKEVDMRYEINGQTLAVVPDTPFLRNYRVDYLNMIRDTTGEVGISAQISGGSSTSSTSSSGGGGATATSAFGGGNTSTTKVTNTAKNRFWETLVQNVKDLLRETDKIIVESATEIVSGQRQSAQPGQPSGAAPGGSQSGGQAGQTGTVSESIGGPAARRVSFREAASVIANPETGVIAVRATSRQHERVQEFLDSVGASAKRQVLIEATIVEVQLSDTYQQGIDWNVLWKGAGLSFTLPGVDNTVSPPTIFTPPSGGNPNFAILRHTGGSINVAVRLLESFGTTRVISSPKLSVLNNQTAILKVVRNEVYFTITPGTSVVGGSGPAVTTQATATPNTVPVGLVMSVTPQISESDTVQINVRPTISRQVATATDPTPGLSSPNLIPVIQTNEMESLIKVESGQIAVMGGLMQDQLQNADDTVPVVNRLPILGNLFAWRNDNKTKTELVIFLRPVVIKNPSLDGDYAGYRPQFPDANVPFAAPPWGPEYFHAPVDPAAAPLLNGGN